MNKIKVYVIMVDGALHEVLSDPWETEMLVKHLMTTGRTVSLTSKWVTIREGYNATE